jgi:hypothetical protein
LFWYVHILKELDYKVTAGRKVIINDIRIMLIIIKYIVRESTSYLCGAQFDPGAWQRFCKTFKGYFALVRGVCTFDDLIFCFTQTVQKGYKLSGSWCYLYIRQICVSRCYGEIYICSSTLVMFAWMENVQCRICYWKGC